MKPAAYTDEEWLLQRLIDASRHTCHGCGEDIHGVEELQLVQVVYANQLPNGKVEFYAIENDLGDYQYKPHFFHLSCWEDVLEQLESVLEDYEPVLGDEHRRVCGCDGCTASIYAWEAMGLISFGELRYSRRKPNGEDTLYFDECNSTPCAL